MTLWATGATTSADSTAGHGRFVVVPAAYVYLLRERDLDTQVLLQLRRGTGFMDEHWAAAAAGHVERGETAYDAARREAHEELGVGGLSLQLLTVMQRTRGGEPIDERVDFFFTSRTWRGEPALQETDKSAGLGWYPLSELPDPVVPHELVVLEGLRDGGLPSYTTHGFDPHPPAEEIHP